VNIILIQLFLSKEVKDNWQNYADQYACNYRKSEWIFFCL